MLCSTAPSLPWVAWASLPHLPRYYAPLRLPPPRLEVLHLSLVPRYLACFHRSWSPLRARSREEAPGHARALGHPVPQSGYKTRSQAALPRSQVPPVKTCPALSPRWCPAHSPCRAQDCCLPATGNRRLPTTLPFSGLHHAACLLATPGFVRPLAGRHAGSLLTCGLDFSQVGLKPYLTRTHWETTTHFMGLRPIPRFWAYLGANSGWCWHLTRSVRPSARSVLPRCTPWGRPAPDHLLTW